MGKYKKLIVGAVALSLMALRDHLGLDLPITGDIVYNLIVAVLGAFGIFAADNA